MTYCKCCNLSLVPLLTAAEAEGGLLGVNNGPWVSGFYEMPLYKSATLGHDINFNTEN